MTMQDEGAGTGTGEGTGDGTGTGTAAAPPDFSAMMGDEGAFNNFRDALPDDIKAAAPPALRHRILLNFEGEAEGVDVEDLIAEIIRDLPVVDGEARG